MGLFFSMLCLRSLLIVSTFLISPAYAETLVGVVVGVCDGDTIAPSYAGVGPDSK